MRLPAEILTALNDTGLDWSIERGRRHNLIKSGVHLLGIVGRTLDEQDRKNKNLVCTIRKNARKIKNGDFVRCRESA